MDADALRENGFKPVNARQASVNGFSLRLGVRATLVPDSGKTVYGVVMSLTHGEVDRLYAEPSVAAYRPEAVTARLQGGEHVAALCFNLPVGPTEVRPGSDYATKLTTVARKLGLPESYVATIA